MYCKNCGKLIPENSRYCQFCGERQYTKQQYHIDLIQKFYQSKATLNEKRIEKKRIKEELRKEKYDSTFEQDKRYMKWGIALIIVNILLYVLGIGALLLGLLVRFIAARQVSLYAFDELNRSKGGWWFFAFLLPGLALIIVNYTKKINLSWFNKEKNVF